MLNLKKTAVAVLALGSSAVFAGTMGPVCAPGNVTIPCERTMWEVGADALYLQPVYSTEGFSPATIGASIPGAYTAQMPSANWGWGFMIEGAYHYGMGNDINVNWYHVNNATNVDITQQIYYYNGGNEGYISQSGNNSIHPEWDAVNVEFGQHVDFGDMKNIRLHGGVEYARVATGSSFLLRNGSMSGSHDLYGFNNSTFNGFGPRGGIDMNYDLGNGFSAYGNGAGGIYVGTGSFNTLFSHADAGSDNVLDRTNFTTNGSRTTLVPELEAKLGLMYHYNMPSMGALPPSELVLDVGWMWVNYFNAQFVGYNNHYFGVDPNDLTREQVQRGQISQSNFGEQGLNFGLKWKGNV